MPNFTSEQILQQIKNKGCSNADLKKLIEEGRILKEQLIAHGIATKEKIDQLFHISPEDHLLKIKNGEYMDEKIIELVNNRTIDKDILLSSGTISSYKYDILFPAPPPPPPPPPNMPWYEWSEIPPLPADRVEVFILGIPGSGKTCFIAGLLFYVFKIGKLEAPIDNEPGIAYLQYLNKIINLGCVPPATPTNKMLYIETNLIDSDEDLHPLTIIEMSGEIFEQSNLMKKEKMNPTFVEYLFSSNRKVFFLAIDFTEGHSDAIQSHKTSQAMQFNYIMEFMKKHGIFQNTEAICLLITKWDNNTNNESTAAEDYLEEDYMNLINQCKKIKKDFSVQFEIFTFSLGKFDHNVRFKYNNTSSKTIYNWLLAITPILRVKKKSGFFGKILGN